ncbi:MMPL family transporter [Haladaptatus sp. DYF46]|uniref:efflux RND transporter permease subunit n=1 Tax=Haladaptatus sp. DYF46 TaxID=2886041 RepID=UPI001E64E8E9|nr:MMPL family transporter [Haladaptatus sp. DYF46]
MKRTVAERFADTIVERSRLVIALLLLVSVVVGAGAVIGETGDAPIGQAGTTSQEQKALDEIGATYGTNDAIVSQVVVRNEDGNVLSRESLLRSLRLQREVRNDDSINGTLRADRGLVGIENVVATAAYAEDVRRQRANSSKNGSGTNAGAPATRPPSATVDQQIRALETRSPADVRSLVGTVLDSDAAAPGTDPTEFLSSNYEPGTTSADARITFVFQRGTDDSEAATQAAYDAQVAIESLVDSRFDDAFVFGQGIVDDASSRAIGDSFIIITPVALVLLLIALTLAYRDLVDVLISVFGVGVVMVWLSGAQAWLGIPSSSLLIAVPFLLIGLSLDYSLHVVMRYREARTGALDTDDSDTDRRSPAMAMRSGLSGVILALAIAAFTTAIGFFSNYVSPLASIRDFALLSGTGIIAMLVVFAALVPAVKLEVERFFDRRGRPRLRSAFGVGDGPVRRALSGTANLARRAPVVVLVVAVLLASSGVYGATGIDTEFNQADFIPQDAPAWMHSLPEPFAPDQYDVSANLAYLSDNFRQRGEGSEAQILVHGNVTDPKSLATLDAATTTAAERGGQNGTVVLRPDGSAAVESPASVLRDVAATNETVAAAIDDRDRDGDGLPDEDVAAVYNRLYDAAPERATTVLYRDANGSYASARVIVGIAGDASAQSSASDARAVATAVERGAPVTAIATGQPVVTAVVQSALFETLVEGFSITLGVILVFLIGLYWWRYRAPELGVVLLVPVLIALAWLLGTMALLDIPFNSETVIITSLAIGLGVDYSIHLGERVVDERARHDTLGEALSAAVVGTGGALLGSAVTTAAGFGVLALALSPPLRRFGTVTGLSIVYALVACVTVLPCLLVIRERLLGRRTNVESGEAAN